MTRVAHVAALVLIAAAACGGADDASESSTSAALGQLTNQIGRKTWTGTGARATTFNYDSLGRVKEVRHAMQGASYDYVTRFGYPQRELAAGATELGTVVQTSQLPDGEIVHFEYDTGGNEQKVTAGNDVIVAAIKRNAKGQVTSVMHGNNVESVHRYNDQGDLWLRQIVSTHRPVGGAARVVQAYDYTFDGAGNTREIRDYCDPDTDTCPCDPTSASCTPRRLSRAFEYDEMDRLTRVKAPAGMTIAGLPRDYAYDAVDNLTLKDGVAQTYGASGKPHALASAGGATYAYDANGNLVSTSAGLTVAWDPQNMAVLTIKSGQRVRKAFFGESVWKKVDAGTTTLYLPSIRIENGKLRKYYGTYAERDPDAGGALRFYHGDHLGSSTLVTDGAGAVVHRAVYLAYGEDDPAFTRTNPFAPKYRFNFKEREATTGLYDYGARMYNPATGRWISPDPTNADGLNRYAYVRNNPVTHTDPDGRKSWVWWERLKEAVRGFVHGMGGPEMTPWDIAYLKAHGPPGSAEFHEQYAQWHAEKFQNGSTAFKVGAIAGPVVFHAAVGGAANRMSRPRAAPELGMPEQLGPRGPGRPPARGVLLDIARKVESSCQNSGHGTCARAAMQTSISAARANVPHKIMLLEWINAKGELVRHAVVQVTAGAEQGRVMSWGKVFDSMDAFGQNRRDFKVLRGMDLDEYVKWRATPPSQGGPRKNIPSYPE